jgi:hypothetical protein
VQHVDTLPYPNRDGNYGSNRGSTVADVQGILLPVLKTVTLEHGLSELVVA